MTPQQIITEAVDKACQAACEGLEATLAPPTVAKAVLEALERAGLVILPAMPTVRLRHEATKGTTGFTPASFNAMWQNLVAYARTLER